MRQCPYCGELIDDATTRCPFCGSTLKPQDNVQDNVQDGVQDDAPVPDGDLNICKKDAKDTRNETSPSLSNGVKVLLSMVSVIPLIGQIIGIIVSIVFMNSEGDPDKKSFGKALLTGTLIITLITCICCIAYIAFYIAFSFYALNNITPKIFEQIQELP